MNIRDAKHWSLLFSTLLLLDYAVLALPSYLGIGTVVSNGTWEWHLNKIMLYTLPSSSALSVAFLVIGIFQIYIQPMYEPIDATRYVKSKKYSKIVLSLTWIGATLSLLFLIYWLNIPSAELPS